MNKRVKDLYIEFYYYNFTIASNVWLSISKYWAEDYLRDDDEKTN